MMRGTWQTTSGGGGGPVVAVIAAAVLIGSGVLTTIVHAVEVLLVVLDAGIALAIIGGVVLLVHRARSDRPGAPIAARVVSQLPPDPRPQLSEPSKQAIEPRRELHLHFHGLTADQIAAMVTRSDAHLEEDK